MSSLQVTAGTAYFAASTAGVVGRARLGQGSQVLATGQLALGDVGARGDTLYWTRRANRFVIGDRPLGNGAVMALDLATYARRTVADGVGIRGVLFSDGELYFSAGGTGCWGGSEGSGCYGGFFGLYAAVAGAAGCPWRLARLPKAPLVGPLTGPCPTPLGSAGELAATPRAAPNLELLALRLDGTLAARQETYDRLSRDVAAIRAAHTAIPAALYGFVALTRDGIWEISGQNFAWLTLDGTYDMAQLARLYARVPGVLSAAPVAYPVAPGGLIRSATGATIPRAGDPVLQACRHDARYGYRFKQGYLVAPADDPTCAAATCYRYRVWGFDTDDAGAITPVGQWDSRSGETEPAWVDACAAP